MYQDKKIKVLETIRQGKIGGGEKHVLDLIANLDKNIFSPVVLSFTDGEMITRLNSMGIKTHIIPTEKPFDVRVWKQVRQLLVEEQINIVHAHGTRACSNTIWPAKKLKLPYLYTVHGWSFHDDQNPLINRMRTWSESLLTKKADTTILVSDFNLKEGLEKFKIKNPVVIKNGIDPEIYNSDAEDQKIREELKIPSDSILVGFIARITKQKDPLGFIKAIKIVTDQTNKFRFLVIGDGELKSQMITMAEDLGLSKFVIFQGFRQDIPKILQSIDIYCLPSLWEGLSIGLLEAMSAKKAIIASAVGGNKEVIQDNVNGILVSPENPGELAKAIIKFQKNPELINSLGESAKKGIVDNFNIKSMVNKVEQLYLNYSNDTKPIPSALEAKE